MQVTLNNIERWLKNTFKMDMDSSPSKTTFMGVEWAPLKLPIERRLQTFALIFFTSVLTFFGVFGILVSVCLLLFTNYLQYLPVIYFTWFLTDKNIYNRGGRMIKWMRRWYIWKWFRDYFPVHLIKTNDLDPNRNYVFGYHPHGIMCAGAFCNFSTEANDFSKKFPGLTSRLVTLEGNFQVPFHRDFVLGMGAIASTKESIEYVLSQEGVGNAVVIVVGGAQEALDASPKNTTLTIKRRKGFVRLALKHGASLVPVFSFGENDLYEQWLPNPSGSWLRFIQNKLTKIMGVSLPLVRGRGVFQYSVGPLPFRKPIWTIVGKPIYLDKVPEPSEQLVSDIHEQYLKSLNELFDEHKAKYGHEDKTLVIT